MTVNNTFFSKTFLFAACFISISTFPRYGHCQILHTAHLEAQIDALIPKAVNDTTPGLVIGIVHNGELIFDKGYGLANLAYGIPNDSKKLYNIGSVSKQVLGYAFAIMHEEGSISLDDPVSKYLTDSPEFEYEVTLRHLLTHTSGYREAYTMSHLAGRPIGDDLLSKEECLEVVKRQPNLEFVPGTRNTYNSTGYVILAEILKVVKGQAAEKWVKENILMPLGMNNTQIESYVGEVFKNTAESYSYIKEQGYTNEKGNRAIFASAEVFTSISDISKWIINYKTSEIGGAAVKETFIDPYILSDETNTEYALGISITSYKGISCFNHGGAHEGFLSQITYFPEYDLGIICMSNFRPYGWVPTTKVADILLKDYIVLAEQTELAIKIKKKNIDKYVGNYLLSTRNKTLRLTTRNDSLLINDRDFLVPIDQNSFRNSYGNVQYKIETPIEGQTQMTVTSPMDKNVYYHIESWSPALNELQALEGDYWSDELETVYHLVIIDDKLTIQHRRMEQVVLEPITKDFFRGGWFYLKMNFDTSGTVSGFSINSSHTLNVNFQRLNNGSTDTKMNMRTEPFDLTMQTGNLSASSDRSAYSF